MDTTTPEVNSSLAPRPSFPETRKSRIINVKVIAIVVGVLIFGALVYYYRGLFFAATVNGVPISRLAVVRELEKNSGKRALDAMITKKLIEEEMRKKGITVGNEEIEGEIKNIESQIATQGGTLEMALAAQGMSRTDLEKEITTQKKIEKLLADQVQVTDEEVEKYIKENAITIPEGEELAMKEQIKNQMKGQKFNEKAGEWMNGLRSGAKIRYFVNY